MFNLFVTISWHINAKLVILCKKWITRMAGPIFPYLLALCTRPICNVGYNKQNTHLAISVFLPWSFILWSNAMFWCVRARVVCQHAHARTHTAQSAVTTRRLGTSKAQRTTITPITTTNKAPVTHKGIVNGPSLSLWKMPMYKSANGNAFFIYVFSV